MTKVAREDFIVIGLFAAVGLVIPTVVVVRHFFAVDPLSWLQVEWGWGRILLGAVLATLATAICLWNCYASLFSPWDYERVSITVRGRIRGQEADKEN